MAISKKPHVSLMELPVSLGLPAVSCVSLFGHSRVFRKCVPKPIRFSLSSEKDFSMNGHCDRENQVDAGDFWGDSEFVEVIGIGSRKDAVLDFCLDSPFQSSSLRFWNILMKDSEKVQLQQRFLGKDIIPRVVEASICLQSCSKAIVLVASAGYGLDHITIIDLFRSIRAANGFTITIVLKPFSFEGRRRQDEVGDLVEKLKEHSNLFIDIDTDTLLKKDLVTLDEALKTAHNAVLLAINAIAVLVSEMHPKLIDLPHCNAKELKFPELIKVLESFKEAKIGFGTGYNIKTSIAQAIYDSPFLGVGVKDLNGMVICILASSGDTDNSDLLAFLQTFRQATEYTKEIIISMIHEPNLEPNLLVTTVIIAACTERQASQKSSILSRLAQHFPFVFDLLRRPDRQLDDTEGNQSLENPFFIKVTNASDSGEMQNEIPVDGTAESLDIYSEEQRIVLSRKYDEIDALRNYYNGYDPSDFGFSEARDDSSFFSDERIEGTPIFQREPIIGRNMGPGYQIAQEWAKERLGDSGPRLTHDNLSIFNLPVGVRSSEELKDSPYISNTSNSEPNIENDVKSQPFITPNLPKKEGMLSARAASMLEAEREAERETRKKWSPILEMQYRGGVYRGRCQGGLPEGKGCLTLANGSIYDGMWRYGKRSGLGTFYFSNGDVFQGSWRDDVMHGKGWFYFHTGDRWFANFWKGKANGEGRFYSKLGDIVFGNFREGWRHGSFLCINVDGARFIEIWDEGVLVSREKLDTDTDTAAAAADG